MENLQTDFEVRKETALKMGSTDVDKFQTIYEVDKEILRLTPEGGGIPDAPIDGKIYARKDGDWAEIDGKIKMIAVDELPTASEDTVGAIYLVPKDGETGDVKNEYITITDGTDYEWELIGNTEIDLDAYYTKEETDELLDDKQDVLTAGDNITITGNEISANLDAYYTKEETEELLDEKQDVLTAGEGIDITDNVISATVEGIEEAPIDGKQYARQDGEWTEISVDLDDYYTKEETDELLDEKQDVLIAGEGITIEDNVISATGGGGMDEDTEFAIAAGINAIENKKQDKLTAGTAITIDGNNISFNRAVTDTYYAPKLFVNETKKDILLSDQVTSEALNQHDAQLNGMSFWHGTEDEYNAITTKNPMTLYVIVEE